MTKVYGVVAEAQAAGVLSAQVGELCSGVDGASRRVIAEAGYGEYFLHRTGHGIGLEEHEDPYMVAGNSTPVTAGHVFSVEPGIYMQGRFGVRIEDIVAATHGVAPAPQPGRARPHCRRGVTSRRRRGMTSCRRLHQLVLERGSSGKPHHMAIEPAPVPEGPVLLCGLRRAPVRPSCASRRVVAGIAVALRFLSGS